MEHECVTAADLLYVLSFKSDAEDGHNYSYKSYNTLWG